MRDTFNYDVFISHSAKDKSAAQELAKQLKHDGIKEGDRPIFRNLNAHKKIKFLGAFA